MAVRIRMKKMGKKHRPFFRICAVDGRKPRDGKVLEELGTYDPMINEADARALLKGERIDYWLGVGAQPSDKVRVLIKKYGSKGTHLDQQQSMRERLAMPKVVPDPGEPAYIPPVEAPAEAPAEAASAAPAKAEAETESKAEGTDSAAAPEAAPAAESGEAEIAADSSESAEAASSEKKEADASE